MVAFGTAFVGTAAYSYRTKGHELYCVEETGVPNLYGCGDAPGPILSPFTVGLGFLFGLALLMVFGLGLALMRRKTGDQFPAARHER